MKRLIVSDIHVGDPRLQTLDRFFAVLKDGFDEIILNGDVVDFWAVTRNNKHVVRFMEELAVLSQKIRTIWVLGNHDKEGESFIRMVLPHVHVCNRYLFSEAQKSFLAIHGHQVYFQQSMSKIARIASSINRLSYRIGGPDLQKIMRETASYARLVQAKRRELMSRYNNIAHIIVTGHTHVSGSISQYKTSLFDGGSWIDGNEYLICENGIMKHHRVS